MSFQEKNVTVSLVNFSLILGFYLIRMVQMVRNGTFNAENLFWLWGIIAVMAVFVTVFAIILTHIVTLIIAVVRTGDRKPKVDDRKDERDILIDLRGTKVTYTVSSLGSFFAMLTFVFGQPPLVMFSALIFVGVVAQVAGDITRLLIYQRGF